MPANTVPADSRSKLSIWLEAARPKTLPASIVPVLVGTAIAGRTVEISWPLFLCIIAASVSIQLTTNFVNDLFDFLKGADTAERKGPRRATQAGLVSPEEMKLASILSVVSAAIFSSYLVWTGGMPILLIGIFSIISAIAYTAGPFPLAYLGLGDLFVMIFFGPVAVAGTTWLFTGTLSELALVSGLATGALSTAILVVNNLRDVDTDRLVEKKTLVVRLGRVFGKVEYIFLLALAGLVPVYLWGTGKTPLLVCLASASLIFAAPLVRNVINEFSLNETLAGTGKLLVVFGVVFSLSLAFS